MHTSVAILVLLDELVTPHGLANLLTAVMEGLDLAWESGIDVDGDRSGGQAKDGLVRIGSHTSDQSHQITKGQNQLLPDLLGDGEKLSPLQKVHQSHGGAVEEAESGHQCVSIFFTEL